MKRVVFLLSMVFVLFSCDDGDVTVTRFNFDTSAIQVCENVLFKINQKELLYIDIPSESFQQVETAVDTPIKVNLGGVNSVSYRLYANNVSTNDFCSTVTPSSAVVANEWFALQGVTDESGYVQISTTKKIDETDGSLMGYDHEVRLINMIFANSSGQFVFDNYLVGIYSIDL